MALTSSYPSAPGASADESVRGEPPRRTRSTASVTAGALRCGSCRAIVTELAKLPRLWPDCCSERTAARTWRGR